MIKTYINKIVQNGKQEDMEELGDIFSDVMYELKEYNEEDYKEYKSELYEMAFGKKISQEMADKWVKEMQPIGIHWTIEETTNAMQSLGYNFDSVDFFVVANMMYNDYYDLIKNDETLALKLAKDWLDDKDAKEDKLYCYWKHIIK